MTQWLNKFVEVEQGLARLNVFKIRQGEFNRLYGNFAPWGSEIKRIERAIEIAEKAYLENLKSYNQAQSRFVITALGGNRGGKWFTYRNLMLTMIIGGLWHGANWAFVFGAFCMVLISLFKG